MSDPVPLDDIDHAIIAALVADGRASIRTLAEQLHISRATAYARLDRLLDGGVIEGFGARVNPERAGYGTSAYVLVSVEQNSWREVHDALVEVPEVVHVALVAAEWDLVTLVRARDNAELRSVVFERLQAVPGVTGTRTLLLFAESHGVASVVGGTGPRR